MNAQENTFLRIKKGRCGSIDNDKLIRISKLVNALSASILISPAKYREITGTLKEDVTKFILIFYLANVDTAIIIGAESGVALGTFAPSCLVARLQTVHTEDVIALGQNRVLPVHLATGARQLILKMTLLVLYRKRYCTDKSS